VRNRTGFTLIELLLVVAVIVLLIALSLPALASVRRQALVVQCASNQRQIGVGWGSYLSQSGDLFPIAGNLRNLDWAYGGNPSAMSVRHFGFPRPLNPFMGLSGDEADNYEVFRCTEDQPIRSVLGISSSISRAPTFKIFGNSYQLNYILVRMDPQGQQVESPLSVGEIELSPSRVLLTADAQAWFSALNSFAFDANFHSDDDRMNVLFLDGHVKFMRIERGVVQTADYSFPITRVNDR